MPDSSLEIERTYLLDGLPAAMPPAETTLRIEQGYLPEKPEDQSGAVEAALEGRLRRTRHPDGRTVCTHTIKRGSGLIRSEIERELPESEFNQHWPRTGGRRLNKTRHVIIDGEHTWEIDDFDELNLILAEVELPDANVQVTIPDWLKPHILRDVTEEKQYRNYELALKLAKLSHSSQ